MQAVATITVATCSFVSRFFAFLHCFDAHSGQTQSSKLRRRRRGLVCDLVLLLLRCCCVRGGACVRYHTQSAIVFIHVSTFLLSNVSRCISKSSILQKDFILPNSTGCANKKTIPLQKFIISVTVKDFFTKFTAFTEEDSGHVCSKFRYNICYGLKITTI